MPKHVVSSSLERAEWNNSTIIADDVIDRVQTLMDHDLVDEYVLLVSPIVRARGIRLFRDSGEQHDLRLTEATVLGGGMLALRMTPARA